LPTKVTGKPSRSKKGASKLWIDNRWSTAAARVLARPGREAQTWGPTYLTIGSLGSRRRSAWATRKVKPQESMSMATSGLSLSASSAVCRTRRTTLG
jgi:hypothetical protein